MNKMEIAECSCQHEFQDKTYGRRMRVWILNPKEKNAGPLWVCTVCGRERKQNA